MGWLQRLFGIEKPESSQGSYSQQPAYQDAGTADEPADQYADTTTESSSDQSIPPERMGLNGEYDQSGLAKRVAQAFDQDPDLQDIDTLYVAQSGSVVVFKGQAPSQEILNQMISVALQVDGATNVETDQVTVG